MEDGGLAPLVSPFPAEIPPYPSTLRTIDVAREVEKVREARKRIKLGAEAFQLGGAQGLGKEKVAEAAKPSVCLFTVHDAGDRCVSVRSSGREGADESKQLDDDDVFGGFHAHGGWVLGELHSLVEPHWREAPWLAERFRFRRSD